MKTAAIAFILGATLVAACGGGQPHVMTPEERLAEQMKLADEQAEKEAEYDDRFDESETDSEEAAKFDDAQADLELRRATNSAKECPLTLPEEQKDTFQKGVATVTLTFANSGHVKDASISSNYADTPVGNCVLRAMGAVIVPDYEGPEKTMDWEVDLTGEQKAAANAE